MILVANELHEMLVYVYVRMYVYVSMCVQKSRSPTLHKHLRHAQTIIQISITVAHVATLFSCVQNKSAKFNADCYLNDIPVQSDESEYKVLLSTHCHKVVVYISLADI